jgi:hypothetical protein
MALKIRDERQRRALTGLSEQKMTKLLAIFSQTYQAQKQQEYEQELAAGTRQRQPGGGRKSSLQESQDKLEFILYYLKTYPTYDDLAEKFDVARSTAHSQVKYLLPILQASLAELGVLPQRSFESVAAFQDLCQQLDLAQLWLDVTERPRQRPQDNDQQRDYYSGKKKTYLQEPANDQPQKDDYLPGTNQRWPSPRLHLTQTGVSPRVALV